MALHTKPQIKATVKHLSTSHGKYILALISVELHENKVQTWFIKPSKFCIYWYETKIMIPPSVQEKSLPLCNPVEHMSTKEKEKETLASLVTKLMHLSMLSPRVGGGVAGRPRGIWHFHESQSQIPHPWAPTKCQIPIPRYCFLPKTGCSYVKFQTPGQNPNVKIPTLGKTRRVNFLWVARPQPWG